jgi:hypothetical protein
VHNFVYRYTNQEDFVLAKVRCETVDASSGVVLSSFMDKIRWGNCFMSHVSVSWGGRAYGVRVVRFRVW